MSLGQTLAPANVRVGHDVWSFNEASAGVACLAHTNDGFLWLGGQGDYFALIGCDSACSTLLFHGSLEGLFQDV
jgi:hypothetical protein